MDPDPEIFLTTDDGVELVADLTVPAGSRLAAAICHPHPQYGGTRHDHVVDALFRALPAAGVAALRFDFRRDFGGGVAERLDLAAALDRLATDVPGVPLVATGYSFGAMVVLGLDDPRVEGRVLVAPPLGMIDVAPVDPDVPTLVLSPAADQFAPPDVAAPIVADWPGAELVTIPMGDHFLHGRTALVVDETLTFLDRVFPRPPA